MKLGIGKRLSRATMGLVAASALALSLVGCVEPPSVPGAQGGSVENLKKISVGVPTGMGPNNAPAAVAQGMGYFAEEGLAVEFVTTGGSTESIQSTLTGQVDIGSSTPESIYQLAERDKSGEDLVMVYNYLRSPTGSLAVLDESPVETIEDLAGLTIGSDTLGSGNILLAQGILGVAGVNPENVSFVATGTGAQALQALKSGQVDALSLWDTEYAAMEATGQELQCCSPTACTSLSP